MLKQHVPDMVTVRIVDLFEMIEINLHQGYRIAGAASTLQGGPQPVLKEPAIGQRGQIVMQGKVARALDLLFQEQQEHADGNDIFGQVPDFAFDAEVGYKMAERRSYNEYKRPGHKAADGDDRPRRALLVRVPEVDAAAHENHKENRINTVRRIAAGLTAQHHEFRAQSKMKRHSKPAKGVLAIAAIGQSHEKRRKRDEDCRSIVGPARYIGDGGKSQVQGAGKEGNGGQPPAADMGFRGNSGPHEAEAGAGQRDQTDNGRED